ncbi:MAG TPA: transcriptional repressor LexA [Phototrophicaceae bacterium]|jgi:repressor LexA|nr:transcriptional repressor LexA [Phototrophicaceae bacterium]
MIKKMEKLSERQQNILRFMDQYVSSNGFPPTIREIGEATRINSTSVVNYNLNKLVKLGYILRTSTKSRGLRLVKSLPGMIDRAVKTGQAMNIPLMGQIVAGHPVQTYDDNQEEIEVLPSMLGNADPSQVYAVRVKGDSMIDSMIRDGDVVILRRVDSAKNGDMVAVWLEDRNETTLKHIYYENDGRVRLQPAHPTMEPIWVNNPRHVHVQGRVLSVIRTVR